MSEYTIPAGKRRLNIKAVCYRYGYEDPVRGHRSLSEATIYRAIKNQKFPTPDKVNGSNSWTESVLDAYDDQLRMEAEGVAA